jgi:hypothetical protein
VVYSAGNGQELAAGPVSMNSELFVEVHIKLIIIMKQRKKKYSDMAMEEK